MAVKFQNDFLLNMKKFGNKNIGLVMNIILLKIALGILAFNSLLLLYLVLIC